MEKEEETGGTDPHPPAPFPVNGRRGVEPNRGVTISVSGAGEDTCRRVTREAPPLPPREQGGIGRRAWKLCCVAIAGLETHDGEGAAAA